MSPYKEGRPVRAAFAGCKPRSVCKFICAREIPI